MAAPKTVVTYDLNGSSREFDFAFDYLARGFVQVTLIGAERTQLQVGTDYTFVSASRIRTTTIYSPPEYTQIEIRRVTSTTERLVDFQDASILRADDLDLSQLQVLHVAEEAREAATETIGTNNFGHLDARGRRIVNVADPVDLGDVVNRRWYEEDKSGAFAAVALAEAARDKAAEWATKTGGPVEGTNYSAKAYANDAGAQRAAAEGYANAANTHRANAVSAENNAKDWAIKATAVEGTNQSAKTYASQAAASAATADGHRQAAAASASAADGHRQAAASSASSAANQVVLAANQVTAAQGQVTLATNQANRSQAEANRAEAEADRALANANTVDAPWLTSQVANPTGLVSVNGGSIGYRNVIINGAMDVAQISESASVPEAGSGDYARVGDCWTTTRNGVGAMRANIQTTTSNQPYPTGGRSERFERCLSVTMQAAPSITAGAYAGVQTNIEGYDTRRFFDRTFTVSFWVRASKVGTYPLAIRNGTAGRSYIGSYTISVANTWERKSVTVTGGIPSSLASQFNVGNQRGLQFVWPLGVGATYQTPTGNSWVNGNYLQLTTHNQVMRANGDVFQITGVQCEVGAVATDFEHEPVTQLLTRVSRYVQSVPAVRVSSVATASQSWGGVWGRHQFPMPMRVTPTVLTASMNSGSVIPIGSLQFDPDPYGVAWAGSTEIPAGNYGIFNLVLSALFD